MKFAKNLLKLFNDSGQNVCLFSEEVRALINNNSIDFSGYTLRSLYFWKKGERPMPIKIVNRILDKFDIKEIDVDYFSVKGGNKIKVPPCEDERFCYLLGVILGDGCIIHSMRGNRNSWSIQITLSSLWRLSNLRKIIEDLFQAKNVYYKENNYYNLHIFSKPLAMLLSLKYEIPVGEKYEKIKVPRVIREKSSWAIAFIRGVFECDGNIYNYRGKKGVQLRQKSKDFLLDMRDICKENEIEFRMPYRDKANNSWVLWSCKKSVVDNFIKKIGELKIKAPVTQSG